MNEDVKNKVRGWIYLHAPKEQWESDGYTEEEIVSALKTERQFILTAALIVMSQPTAERVGTLVDSLCDTGIDRLKLLKALEEVTNDDGLQDP